MYCIGSGGLVGNKGKSMKEFIKFEGTFLFCKSKRTLRIDLIAIFNP